MVGVSGSGLTYNGYDVSDLAENTTFYETAYLIFHGELPNQQQIDKYAEKIKANRGLPKKWRKPLKMIQKAHIRWMSCAPVVPCLVTSNRKQIFSQQQDAADRLFRSFSFTICYWYKF